MSSAPRRWLDSQKSTETRQSTLSEYCQSLVNLPPHISRCDHLSSFFKVRPEDENPPAANTSVPHTRRRRRRRGPSKLESLHVSMGKKFKILILMFRQKRNETFVVSRELVRGNAAGEHPPTLKL